MKIHLDLPWGGTLDFESKPMEPYKFYTLCWTVCLAVVLPALFSLCR